MSSDPPKERASFLADQLFDVRDAELAIGGVTLSELAGREGTPFYAYDAAGLRRQYRALRDALPERIDIYYSIKANPNPAVAKVFVECGAGIEIASVGEYRRARLAGAPADRILFAGPGKTREELDEVTREGIGEIHAESAEEIARLARLGRPVQVAIRFNPAAVAGGGAMRMGGKPAAFGFDEETLDEAVAQLRSHPTLHFSGLHMFAGTQILDSEVLVGQWRHAIGVARLVSKRIGAPLETVDLGGGLGIPYFPNETELELESLRSRAADLFDELAADPAFEGTRFIVEPGRFLAGPCGLYVARVNVIKESRGQVFVVLDGGMHHHLAASGNLGQVIKRDYPILNASRMNEKPGDEVAVVGPLCTPLDTIGRKTRLAAPRVGDLVAVLQSGAYGLTASPVGFLSHPTPAEFLVDEGDARCIRRRGASDAAGIRGPD